MPTQVPEHLLNAGANPRRTNPDRDPDARDVPSGSPQSTGLLPGQFDARPRASQFEPMSEFLESRGLPPPPENLRARAKVIPSTFGEDLPIQTPLDRPRPRPPSVDAPVPSRSRVVNRPLGPSAGPDLFQQAAPPSHVVPVAFVGTASPESFSSPASPEAGDEKSCVSVVSSQWIDRMESGHSPPLTVKHASQIPRREPDLTTPARQPGISRNVVSENPQVGSGSSQPEMHSICTNSSGLSIDSDKWRDPNSHDVAYPASLHSPGVNPVAEIAKKELVCVQAKTYEEVSNIRFL